MGKKNPAQGLACKGKLGKTIEEETSQKAKNDVGSKGPEVFLTITFSFCPSSLKTTGKIEERKGPREGMVRRTGGRPKKRKIGRALKTIREERTRKGGTGGIYHFTP